MTKLNAVIVPILIASIFILGIKNISQIGALEILGKIEENQDPFWFIQSILYASYNLILLIPVLINLKNYLKNKRQIQITSVITGILMGIVSILTFLLLVNVDIEFTNLEMPIIYVIEKKFTEFKYIYGMIILIAIFTTAISVGVSFLYNICKNKKRYPQIAGILCITSILIAPIGFSNLVKILFPLFGYLGCIQIYFIQKNKKD